MLDDINELRTFVRIAAAGSLSAAGREMNLALSVVSKRLASLERRTDTRLVARSTRRLALTEEGQRLYRHAQRILAEIAEAEEVLSHGRVEPQGILRVGAPAALGRMHVGPVCRELVEAHPRISVDLCLTDRMMDLIDEGMDVVVRIGAPKESTLVMRRLADNHRIVVGAPAYLDRRGWPVSPEELEDHDCIQYRGTGGRWRLIGPGGAVAEVDTASRLRSDNGDIAQDWALAGCGLIWKSQIDVQDDLAAGRLRRVLPDWHGAPAPVCALFPSQRQLPTRVRLFLDTMARRLNREGAG
ncbi:LysR family transcriptional regulator [Azospirillum sp. TSH100]|uniref:LysR family transcriptional regulator n=1 Tax=Azospirillum sp. TSH100 TaxID=652764 RepID=UPI000D6145E5|nr:LysR family transcriptional regulator [Azospirillum sp. TSH100]PWC89353.1 LysR family transcriptional regulator [Azospirillum sp. TSH100]QCG90292.1 LysR family transcriptional regulator [Azospirillum sp. TSH100]